MRINNINNTPYARNHAPLKRSKPPSFKSEYEIDGNTIASRQQVFTMGMLMSNFWIRDARNTFNDIKRKGIYGKFNIKVNDYRDDIVERILNNNMIKFTKIDPNKRGYYYY